MKTAYAINSDNEKLSLKTYASEVFDENGIDLNANIDLLLQELSKKELKRFYYEFDEIHTNTLQPTTYELMEAMADDSIAILSVANDSYLVNEIGSRAGGVMILVKRTSVYFSCALFITYRYGYLYHGYPGLAGTSLIWTLDTKSIHSLHMGGTSTLSNTDTYVKLTGWGGQAVNSRLSIQDGALLIPKGVSYIMVSAEVVLEAISGGTKYMQIFKNNQESAIMVKQTVGESESTTLVITPLLMEVAEGDLIDLRINSNSLDRLRMKHLTAEVIQ